MALIEVKVPDIGDFKEVEVIETLVKVGDTIAKEQSLLTVESDKASMEIPSPVGGVVKELRVKVGDKVAEGTLILMVQSAEPQQVNTTVKNGDSIYFKITGKTVSGKSFSWPLNDNFRRVWVYAESKTR